MGLINQLEQKFGRFAIPGILRIIGGFQLLVLLLFFIMEKEADAYFQMLNFNRDAIFAGEIWRIVTFLFIPPILSLWAIIAVMFLFMLSDGLEQAWGSFRVNLYVYSSVLLLIIANLFLGAHGAATGFYLFEAVLLAFACIYPDHIIRLFFVIPIKMKWVAGISAGLLVMQLLGTWGTSFFYPVFMNIFASLTPFFAVFGPPFLKGAKQRSEVSSRRQKFESSMPDEDDPLHTCATCKKTELTNPELGFRVTAEGEEYCEPCLKEFRNESDAAN